MGLIKNTLDTHFFSRTFFAGYIAVINQRFHAFRLSITTPQWFVGDLFIVFLPLYPADFLVNFPCFFPIDLIFDNFIMQITVSSSM